MSAALGILLVVVVPLGAAAAEVARSLMTDEARGWLPHIARHLVRSAARGLPADDRGRWEEEWLGELDAYADRPITAIAKAAGIRWNARAMRESLGGRRDRRGRYTKRALDVVASAIVLVVLAPLLAALALLVKLDTPGPVFFRQRRIGRDGKPFGIVKFRSTYVDAEPSTVTARMTAGGRSTGTVTSDPRITRIGAILRRTPLDELPQLWNVLRGEMSLVGPRPLTDREQAYVPRELRRLSGRRPGLAGLWQVGGRSTVNDMLRLDHEYESRWSLWSDFKLLLRTVRAVLRGRRG